MLKLLCATPSDWLEHALANLDEVLIDHAHCEKKATATALSLLSSYPDNPPLAEAMAALAEEEAGHLRLVVDALHARGLKLGRDPGDEYAQRLMSHVRGGDVRLLDRLLVAACIEARSCERLKLLAENVPDAELAELYRGLWQAEAGHFTLFTDLARKLYPLDVVDQRLAEILRAESEIIQSLPVRAVVH